MSSEEVLRLLGQCGSRSRSHRNVQAGRYADFVRYCQVSDIAQVHAADCVCSGKGVEGMQLKDQNATSEDGPGNFVTNFPCEAQSQSLEAARTSGPQNGHSSSGFFD